MKAEASGTSDRFAYLFEQLQVAIGKVVGQRVDRHSAGTTDTVEATAFLGIRAPNGRRCPR